MKNLFNLFGTGLGVTYIRQTFIAPNKIDLSDIAFLLASILIMLSVNAIKPEK